MISEAEYIDDLKERVLDKIRAEARSVFDDFDINAVVFNSTVNRTNNVLASIDVTGKVRSLSARVLKHNVCIKFSHVNLSKSNNVRRKKS